MPKWHATFRRMRGMHEERNWMSWQEFRDYLKALGVVLTRYQLRKALASNPPKSVRGWKRYESVHAVLAVGYAKGEGWYE